jgi:spore maturation protein CgeB
VPNLERYYQPGQECVTFDDLDDCVAKAKYYLAHESERARIARAYHDRTRAEHLWRHRFTAMFQEIGLR